MRRLVLFAAAALLCLAPSAARAQTYGDPTSLVNYWYQTYLGRPGDGGMTYWVNHLQQGDAPDSVLAGILASDEFYQRAGNTPQGYIALLFNDILKRPPSANELNYWVGRMYTEDRQGIAEDLLTQNPGTWVGAGTVYTPPPVVQPGVVVTTPPSVIYVPHDHWERDRHIDWAVHHDIHEYHRPEIHHVEVHRRR